MSKYIKGGMVLLCTLLSGLFLVFQMRIQFDIYSLHTIRLNLFSKYVPYYVDCWLVGEIKKKTFPLACNKLKVTM